MTARPQDLSESEIDRVLLEGAAKRDREALGALYERYGEPLYHYLACAGASAEDAQSALYAVFAGVWQNPRPYLKLDPFRPHIFGQAYRAAGTLQNAKSEAAPFRTAIALNGADEIAEALNGLDPFARHILILSEVCRLGYREMADALGESAERIADLKTAAFASLVESLHSAVSEPPESAKPGADSAREIAAYADGELTPDDSAAVEAMLNADAAAAKHYARLLRIRDTLRRISPARPPRTLWERIEQTIRKRELRQRSSAARLAVELVLLAAAAIVGVAGWIVSDPGRVEAVRRRLPARLGGLEGASPLPLERKGEPASWVYLPVGDGILTPQTGGRAYALPRGTRIRRGETVEIRAGGPANVVFPDGEQILAKAGARFQFEAQGANGVLVLLEGDFACSIFSGDKPFELRTPNASFTTHGADVSISVGKAGGSGQPNRQEGPIVTRVLVSYGEMDAQGQTAVTGETMTIAGEQDPKVGDTPFADPLLGWAAEARKNAVFEAVDSFSQLRRQFGLLVASKDQEAVFTAATDGDFAPLFAPFVQAEQWSAEPWYVEQLQNCLQAMPNLEILSARRFGERVILRAAVAGHPGASARVVMEKREKAKDEPKSGTPGPISGQRQPSAEWKITLALGEIARPTPPGSDTQPARTADSAPTSQPNAKP